MQDWLSYFSSVMGRSVEATLTSFGQTWLTLILLALPFVITWAIQHYNKVKEVGWKGSLSLSITLAWKIEVAVILLVFVGNFLAVIYKDHSETEDKLSDLNNTVLSLKKDSDKLEELSFQLNEAREVIGLLQEGNSKLQREVDLLRGKGKSIDADRPRLQVTGSSFEKIADGDRLVIFYRNYGASVAKDIDSTVTLTIGAGEKNIRDSPRSPLELPPGAGFGLQVILTPSVYDDVIFKLKTLEYKITLDYKNEQGKSFRYERYGYYDTAVKEFTFGSK